MISDYEIIEYCNPSFPDVPYYKCKIGDEIYHTTDYASLVDKVIYFKTNEVEYIRGKQIEATAMASFMADVKIKD